ncbi:tRNA selenocysteine 1-associated protein 1-like [Sycon ciliatum]|uniref:tRNA selenocysteine 1-associated protein 1-like n=1 Tax=Sycon ciliatum TaxID=27933 RepID=UPI0020AAB279|eukprot:scpid58063/ scgid13233/ tRNA selenocysteine 1-associated protein 1; tRNA selenocysteine-associated protein 1
MSTTASASTLWIGGLESYMDDKFITNAFAALGESFLSIRTPKIRGSSQLAGYAFIDVTDEDTATQMMKKLNGLPIPGSEPVKHFIVKRPSARASGPEFSVFVGDLSNDVTSEYLNRFFRNRYTSVRDAVVMSDAAGLSRGFGFVRFTDPDEQQRAMTEMQGAKGCGTKPLRVSAATSGKNRTSSSQSAGGLSSMPATGTGGGTAGTPTYDPATMLAMLAQQQQQPQQPQQQAAYMPGWPGVGWAGQQQMYAQTYPMYDESAMAASSMAVEPCEDPNPPIDTEELNAAIFRAENVLFDDMESSQWQPVESVMSGIPSLLPA